MVESNIVTVTFSAVTPPPTAISLTLSVNKSSYDPNVDTLTFTVAGSASLQGKAVELYVDGQGTGIKNTVQGTDMTHIYITVSPSNMPAQLKAQGSHSCKVVSYGW